VKKPAEVKKPAQKEEPKKATFQLMDDEEEDNYSEDGFEDYQPEK
jgi:hypothetical protein